jgi:hypothetical protein
MAITKVAQFLSSPTTTADYEGQNAHVNAFIQQMANQVLHLTEWTTTTVPQIAQGVYLRHAGVLYIVDTAAFDIATGDLSGAGTYYIKLTTSGDSLAVAWEDTLTSYAWSIAYQGYYNGTSQILPYKVVYATAPTYTKYSITNMASASASWNFIKYNGGIGVYSIEQGGVNIKTDVINIGDWDMDADATKNIAHGVVDFTKIRDVSAMIRNDTGTDHYQATGMRSGGAGALWISGIKVTNITLTRDGTFDNTGFDSTSYNRGWVTVVYEV